MSCPVENSVQTVGLFRKLTAYMLDIKSFQSPDKYKTISKKLQAGRVSAKTIRKWHLNVMIKEGHL